MHSKTRVKDITGKPIKKLKQFIALSLGIKKDQYEAIKIP